METITPDSNSPPTAGAGGSALTRRNLLKTACGVMAGLPLLARTVVADPTVSPASAPATAPSPTPTPAFGGAAPAFHARLGEPVRYHGLHGDSWNPTWADDGDLYTIADDTEGFLDHPISSNLAIYKITGDRPREIKVELVNTMPQFGKCTELNPVDNCCWKASSLSCIDGILYLAVSRNRYARIPETFDIQQSWDATILSSRDHGKTWSATPDLNHAMFPGHAFSNPAFVQYGKNGAAGPDGSDVYIYATSNDGTWNNGNSMILGRVRRDRIAALQPADWEFVHDFNAAHQPLWGPRPETAIYTFRAPGRTGMAGIQHVPALGRYILPQWHYPTLNESPQTINWSFSRFELYESAVPWGPWTLFHSQDYRPLGLYNPSIPSKFISADGRNFWMLAAGDFSTKDHPYYTINMIPVSLT